MYKTISLLLLFSVTQSDIAFAQRRKSSKSKEKDKNKPTEVLVVTTALSEIYEPKSFGGFVQADKSLPAVTEVAGTVMEYLVKPGQRVKQGTVLALLKPKGADGEFQLHKVRAPMDGTVMNKLEVEGRFVQIGDPLMQVARPEKLKIETFVSYAALSFLKMTSQIFVSVQSPDGLTKQIPASIAYISPAPNPDSSSYGVKVLIQCPLKDPCREVLRIGSFARVVVKTNIRRGIKIPRTSLKGQDNEVYEVNADNILKKLAVKVGTYDGTHYEITEGLKVDKRVVVKHTGALKEDTKVLVKSLDSETKKELEKAKVLND